MRCMHSEKITLEAVMDGNWVEGVGSEIMPASGRAALCTKRSSLVYTSGIFRIALPRTLLSWAIPPNPIMFQSLNIKIPSSQSLLILAVGISRMINRQIPSLEHNLRHGKRSFKIPQYLTFGSRSLSIVVVIEFLSISPTKKTIFS